MVASTDIKFFVHSNNNAPQLQNAYGSMIGALDACLVNGISLGSVSTLTAMGTTVTAVFSNAHNLMQYQVLKITGANQAEYNGEHRILTVPNATSVTFQLASTPSVTTATGSITASLPPLGWEKPFSSTNVNGGGKAAYRSKNTLLPSRPFLRVVDELDPAYTATYAKFAKVGIVEDMTDIDTMLGVQAPYDAALPNKNWVGTGSGATAINGWAKWYYAAGATAITGSPDSTAPAAGNRSWLLVGSKDVFYIFPTMTNADSNSLAYGFGAFESLLNVDSANTFLSSTLSYAAANSASIKGTAAALTSTSISSSILFHRKYTNEAISNNGGVMALGASSLVSSGSSNYVAAVSITNTILQSPVFFSELSNVIRGEVPYLNFLYQIKPYANMQRYEKSGHLFIAKDVATGNNTGQVVIKVGDL